MARPGTGSACQSHVTAESGQGRVPEGKWKGPNQKRGCHVDEDVGPRTPVHPQPLLCPQVVAAARCWSPRPSIKHLLFWGVCFFVLFIYLFMAVLALRFCARALSSCGKRGPLFIAVRGPLTIAASLAAEHQLQTRRLSNCGSRAQLLRSMWDLPRPRLEPVSSALAGRLSTTAPPGNPQ